MKNQKQLSYEQRYQIYMLKKVGLAQAAIAEIVGVNQSTISRELKRNRGLNGCRHQQALRLHDQRREATYKASKMTPECFQCVEQKLLERWSPEQISGCLLDEKGDSLSHETIYHHIW